MKNLLILSFIFIGLQSSLAQTELELISNTLRDYIEGSTNGQPERLKKAFHPDLNLYYVGRNNEFRTWSGTDYIADTKEGQPTGEAGKIISIDYENDAAVAKVEISHPESSNTYVDYFMLLKIDGQWTIIHKMFTKRTSNKKDKLDISIEKLMKKHQVPGLSLAIIKNGRLRGTRNYGWIQEGQKEPINNETMFSVGSVSKVGNAILILKLVKDGKLDLDADVNQYLKDWKIEKNAYSKNNPVTLRKLLSHTAGLSVHGFDDFLPGEPLPTTLQILNGEGPAKNEKVKLIFPVGSQFKYSGGGTTVMQKIIEDVTGLPYHEAAQQILFEPLGLKRTSYENPIPASFGNIAKAHNSEGKPVALPRGYEAMPEKAASGLWTTPSDLARLLAAVMASEKEADNNLLSPSLIQDMISPEKNSQYGLGPEIETTPTTTKVFHDGANESYRANFTLFWENKTGFVVFTNGNSGYTLIKELKPILEVWVN